MSKKKFLKVLADQRSSLHLFHRRLPLSILQNPQETETVLLNVIAGRIFSFMFEKGKFRLVRTLTHLHLIAANMVLYLEIQKRDSQAFLRRTIKGYQSNRSYRMAYWDWQELVD